MKKEIMNYEAILKITKAIANSRDPEDVVWLIVESIKTALGAKGCALLLFNRKTDELEVAASHGLSKEYLSKGPLSSTRSIANSLKDGPVAIYDVTDDPRIQYPEEARREGIGDGSGRAERTFTQVFFTQPMRRGDFQLIRFTIKKK